MKKILASILLLIVITPVNAQFHQGLYTFRNLPLSRMYNPSLEFENDKEILLPIISHVQVQGQIYGTNLDEIFSSATAEQTIENFIATKNGKEHLWVDEMINLFYYGFKDKSSTKFWSFGIYHEIQGYTFYPADVVDVAYNGNQLNKTYTVNDIRSQATALTVYHAGLTYKPKKKKYTLGGRVKIYNALGAIDATGNKGSVTTIKDTINFKEQILINGIIRANSSGTTAYTENTYSQIFKNSIFSGNIGLGIDFGATYFFDKNWSASFSVIDFGAIYFSQDLANYKIEGVHNFEGAIIYNPTSSSEDFWDQMINNLKEDIKYGENKNSFLYKMPPKIIASATYTHRGKRKQSKSDQCSIFRKKPDYFYHYFTFTSYNKLLYNYWDWALGVSYMGEINSWFALQANYLFSPYDKTNFGIGVSFNFEPVLFYLSVDNVLGLNNLNKANSAGAFVGINLVLN